MAKKSKKQRAADRFLDVLQQRQEDFAAIEDSRAKSIRRHLHRTRREAQQLVAAHQKQFARKGHYLTGVASFKQAQETAQDIDTLMRRDFMRVQDRLISFKEEAFEAGVWDFDVASQKLPGNLRGRMAGTFSQIMPEAVYAAAEHPVMGIGPELTFNGIQTGTEQRVRDVLTQAVLGGASIQDTTAILDEALNVSVDAAERIARTGLNAAYNDAHKMIYDANADIFSGYRWDAIMDDRTSPICVMLHGQFWPLGSTPPGPPAHWNCRSILTPVFQDPALNRMMMEDTTRVRNFTADGKEKYGWIKNKTSAQDWLRKQPTAVSYRVTGSHVKNRLFRTGKIDMNDIVSPDLVARTDKQVLRRAWSKNPTDKTVAELAHANGVHRAPRWNTIAQEDAALARKQSFDMPVSVEAAESDPAALATIKVSPERMTKWKDDLAATEEDMELAQLSLKQLRKDLRTAPADLKGSYTRQINQAQTDYARLRNKKWRINNRIKKGGGPGPQPLPRPVIDLKVAQLETAWQETVDELGEVRDKLAAARKANNTERIALLRKDEARLVNKRWRRWKRLPPDSQLRLKTGVKPKPPKLPTPPKKLTPRQRFDTGVEDVEAINKRIIANRSKVERALQDNVELKALQTSRTRAMNKLRAARRADKSLPELPLSTRLPKAVKPKVVRPKAVKPGEIKVQFSPEVQKLQQQLDELQTQVRDSTKELRVLRREETTLYGRRLQMRQAGQTGTSEYRNLEAARSKLSGKLNAVDRHTSSLRLELKQARRKFQKVIGPERDRVLGQLGKPGFVTDHKKAVARAKAELDALGYDLTALRHSSMDPGELLDLLSAANGQGLGAPLTPIRQKIFDNMRKEITRLGQWNQARAARLRTMLTSMDESLLDSPLLNQITYQRSPRHRASANKWLNNIKLKKGENTHTIGHEFGHHVQYRNERVARRTRSWMRGRTKDDRLTTIYKGTKERGKKDEFWTHYVGRVYDDGFQEGTSMGLQTFMDKRFGGWAQITKTDPDHMYLIWAMLRGY